MARKKFTVTVLPPCKAKGRYRKGEGFNRGVRVVRKPTMFS
jgi:hypothetical protein